MAQATPDLSPAEAAKTADSKPLRRDAERNRQRVLAAAREMFAERGIGVTLDDIAAHAGVGVGTVYRRFADRNALVDALFEERIDEMTAAAAHALTLDPWAGLEHFLRSHLDMQMRDRSFAIVFMSDQHGRGALENAKGRIKPLVGEVVGRAQAAGVVRPDFEVTDVPMLALMLGSIVDATRDAAPDLWRRYLALVLDGIRPTATTPLPREALDPDLVPEVMRCGFASQR